MQIMQIQTIKQPPTQGATCSCCGRPLSHPISVELGINAQCRIRAKNDLVKWPTLSLFGSRSNFSWDLLQDVITIVDLSGNGPGLTEDMPNVLREIAMSLGHGLQHYHIMYRDSQGIWDGVHQLNRGKVRFFSINEKDYELAKAKLL